MAFRVYLCGHGSWRPDDAFVNVPRKCSVLFYGHFAKTVMSSDTEKLVAGEVAREPHAIHREYMMCPNMTLSPTSQNIIDKKFDALARNPNRNDAILYFTPQRTNLKTLFEDEGWMMDIRGLAETHGLVELVWSCCRSVTLKYHRAAADEIGWNAIDRFPKGKFELRYKARGTPHLTRTDVRRAGGHIWVRGQDKGAGTVHYIKRGENAIPHGTGLEPESF